LNDEKKKTKKAELERKRKQKEKEAERQGCQGSPGKRKGKEACFFVCIYSYRSYRGLSAVGLSLLVVLIGQSYRKKELDLFY
jgi:hypothetical protein